AMEHVVAVLDHHERAGVVAGKVVEEDVVGDHGVPNAIDVDVLVPAALIVKYITLDCDAYAAVVELHQVIEGAVVNDVVPECNVAFTVQSAPTIVLGDG